MKNADIFASNNPNHSRNWGISFMILTLKSLNYFPFLYLFVFNGQGTSEKGGFIFIDKPTCLFI